jgi:hypothetical protein
MISPAVVRIGDIASHTWNDVSDVITSISVSHTMDLASMVSLSVLDTDMTLLKNRAFALRRDVEFRGERFEIASLDYALGETASPVATLECYPRAVQRMKRDKQPRNFGSTSGYDYVKKVADEFNLFFVGEPTSKTQSIPQAKNDAADESVWDVVKRVAEEAKFVCFVVSVPYDKKNKKEGILFFISQKQLLKTWGPTTITGNVKTNGVTTKRKKHYVPLRWTSQSPNDAFVTLGMPSFRKSDNDWREAEGKVSFWNDPYGNAQQIRPGMTIRIFNMTEQFNGYYLITSVEWSENEPGPVNVSFRTVERTGKKEDYDTERDPNGDPTQEVTLTSTQRRENLNLIKAAGINDGRYGFIEQQPDDFIIAYANKIKEATELGKSPYTMWVL